MAFADNALAAKIRASYGKRLREEDYKRLIEAKTLPEVVGYLKSETHYKDVLLEVQQDTVHRGQIERLVQKKILSTCLLLTRYSHSDKFFLLVYEMQNEIEILLTVVRFLNAGNIRRFIQALPLYMDLYLSLDLEAMGQISSYQELLDTLVHTRYLETLRRFPPDEKGHIDVLGCEKALLTLYYSTLFDFINKEYRGRVRSELLDLFGTEVNNHNLLTIYRLKKYFSYEPEEIRPLLLWFPTKISKDTLEHLLQTEDVEQLLRKITEMDHRFIQYMVEPDAESGEIVSDLTHIRLAQARRIFRFSNTPIVVAVCFLTLMNIEAANITHLVEGTRYQAPPEEIQKLLAY